MRRWLAALSTEAAQASPRSEALIAMAVAVVAGARRCKRSPADDPLNSGDSDIGLCCQLRDGPPQERAGHPDLAPVSLVFIGSPLKFCC
jgi:hypothetical protein